MIKNNRYDQPMTTLGTLVGKGNGFYVSPLYAAPLDVTTLVASLTAAAPAALALGTLASITASIHAWVNQDDDAHEPCSLTACRHPLHPGPCKGWKGTLHSVAPGTYHQIEAERVKKANERRIKRIADLRSQGKPIPRRLLTEIKAKPAPTHPANGATTVPLSQVNQKADLAGGQAHTAGQAVSKAAGVKVNTPLPLGPKKKKPTVAGRGPAFVITQPKVTDTYKLDKAEKITPAEWNALTDADKTTIRNELTAIKARGFGPQQAKADALLAKLPAPGVANGVAPSTPGTVTTPSGKVYQKVSATPGKVSLGQAAKPAPASAPAATTSWATPLGAQKLIKKHGSVDITYARNTSVEQTFKDVGADGSHQHQLITKGAGQWYITDKNGKELQFLPRQSGIEVTINQATTAQKLQGNTPASPHGLPATPPTAPRAKPAGPDPVDQVKAAQDPSAKLTPAARLFIYRKLSKAQFDSLDPAAKKQVVDELDGHTSQTAQRVADELKQKFGVSGTPTRTAQAAPAPSPATPSGPTPSAPMAPGTAAHIQHANAVANRSAPKAQMAKTQVDSYDKLSKADFDQLDPAAQKTIRDDLANAKAKFLDPKKRQAASDLLNRFGSRHPAPAAPAGGKAQGYSDPMNQAVSAVKSEPDRDVVVKRVGQLSLSSTANLTQADRQSVINRLDATAASRVVPQATSDRAAAFSRIIQNGSPARRSRTWDHEPSVAELYAEEQKNGAAKDALRTQEALDAASSPGMDRADRLKALTALTRTQFDGLSADDQRKITDALHGLHTDRKKHGMTQLDPDAEKAITTYTGLHPGIHRIRQAEADLSAGKIDTERFYREYLGARVQSPSSVLGGNTPGAALEKEAARIARDTPTLPTWLRATMIENPYGGGAYYSIAQASNRYNYEAAPRLGKDAFSDIFRATEDELKSSDPIHAQAVKELRAHVLLTGLAPGSPWSAATKNQAVDNLLHTSYSDPQVPLDRLREFEGMDPTIQVRVRRVLRDRIASQTSPFAKTGTYITLQDVDGGRPAPDVHAALMAASDTYASPSKLDVYRKLTPNDFDDLPKYARDAIADHLTDLQRRAERPGPVRTWTAQDDPLEVFPGALKDHLNGMRTAYNDRRTRHASDVANFGTKIINPMDRTKVYSELPISQYRNMSQGDQDLIRADLDSIAADPMLSVRLHYNAQTTKDFTLDTPNHLSLDQLRAVGAVNPNANGRSSDSDAEQHLGALSKAEYDQLATPYREAIDARVATLPASSQQLLSAKFHPAAATANPAGFTPTAGTVQAPLQPHVQAAIDTIYGVHSSGKSHTMAHQLSTYGALRGSDFGQLNGQEQQQLLGDLSFIATTAKGPSAAKAKLLIDRFTPPGTPAGSTPTPAIIPPVNAVAGQVRYASPLKGLAKAKDSGKSGDGWINLPGGQRVWGAHGAAGLLLQHVDPQTGEKRYLMVQRGPAISDPGKWTFPGGASDSKETPHQGATRETIEELGLKDDVFKDALVHGDHTFTIPGSTWKYTTVAAQVPNMIKPDLSTAHARAETSDAKWMTEAEIKALDKAGKLHAPIAGGKLEQNVISLFPQGAGVTLSQAARPGPVTKRLGRLHLPSGGRQAPANFNAWPHPHKQSKGKDLIPDKTASDAMRQKLKTDRKLYDGKTADGRLAAIGAMQGFDDTPTVVDRKEIDRLLATGDYIEVFRGVTGAGGYGARARGNAGGKTAAQINEEMRSGPAYYGKGIFGNGYYLATQRRVATQYADGSNGSVARMLIPKSAITKKYDEVKAEAFKNPRQSKAKGASQGWGAETSTFYDPGRYAAAKGIDGIEINPHHVSPSGGAGHVASHGKPAFNWLNRSVLIMQKEPG